jgi:toxin YoeB
VKVCFTEDAWEEYLYWQKTARKIVKKINELIKSIKREPFIGVGKPEPLKFGFQKYWLRRIDIEYRLVYKVEGDVFYIAQCRYHYQND